MKQGKSYKYILGLAILVSFISFSGFYNNIEFPSTTTEWVIIEKDKSPETGAYVYSRSLIIQKITLIIYFDFHFDRFLYNFNSEMTTSYKSLIIKFLKYYGNINSSKINLTIRSITSDSSYIFIG